MVWDPRHQLQNSFSLHYILSSWTVLIHIKLWHLSLKSQSLLNSSYKNELLSLMPKPSNTATPYTQPQTKMSFFLHLPIPPFHLIPNIHAVSPNPTDLSFLSLNAALSFTTITAQLQIIFAIYSHLSDIYSCPLPHSNLFSIFLWMNALSKTCIWSSHPYLKEAFPYSWQIQILNMVYKPWHTFLVHSWFSALPGTFPAIHPPAPIFYI